ncbi:MAG: class I SAM-dependent methyltransferase [Proteobacteria bacterium]|nr:class I SAM-dependent methyltransferase [Pseudomonadota bacterium]
MRRPDGHPVLAAILDVAMKGLEGVRHKVVPLATGDVLEIGVGTGLNAAIYDVDKLTSLVGIEPDPHMLKRAQPRFDALPVKTELVQTGAEEMPFDDASFDAIVLTFTLCTIPDVDAALREMYRVLKPGGAVFFAEHTLSDHGPMQGFQNLINPVWGVFSGGCNVNRNAVELLRDGGFHVDEIYGHGRGAINFSPVHRGVAYRPEML